MPLWFDDDPDDVADTLDHVFAQREHYQKRSTGGSVAAEAPQSAAAIEQYPRFAEFVRDRLEMGRQTYGDRSFERPMGELITEIQQELFDVSGWAFILWTRLEKLRVCPCK